MRHRPHYCHCVSLTRFPLNCNTGKGDFEEGGQCMCLVSVTTYWDRVVASLALKNGKKQFKPVKNVKNKSHAKNWLILVLITCMCI